MFKKLFVFLALTITLLVSSIASAQVRTHSPEAAAGDSIAIQPTLQVNHVFIVMEENHSYSEVIGSPRCHI